MIKPREWLCSECFTWQPTNHPGEYEKCSVCGTEPHKHGWAVLIRDPNKNYECTKCGFRVQYRHYKTCNHCGETDTFKQIQISDMDREMKL
jgi:hypothetical protein